MTAGTGRLGHSLEGASHVPFWLDDPDRPAPTDPLDGDVRCDLLVVGGGYAGLWTALLAKERDPARNVVLLEADSCGHAASGRNGGFAEPSLTHGIDNGLARWPAELPRLLQLGRQNLDELAETVERYDIDCHLERTGELTVATKAYQVAELAESAEAMRAHGLPMADADADAARERFDSPAVLGALHDPEVAVVEPARLAWGLRRACLDLGVRVFEGSDVTSLRHAGGSVVAATAAGQVRARQVALATNAYRPLLRRLSLMCVPVFDYALVTEPLSTAQRDAIGWAGREGVGDSGNQFHYLRQTRDHRILFGGYDAVYHYGSSRDASHDCRPETYALLADHFSEMFPALDDVAFTHAWGGMIDTSTQFSAFYGTAMGGQVTYALGFTGLGVAATRFAAQVMLDLLSGERTERTQLEMVRKRPLPFPPEPVRYAGVQATRWSLACADERDGKRNTWLRLTDALGLGFDS